MSEAPEVVRWYTSALRIPRYVGKLPDGTPLPGGPYTLIQFGGGAAVVFLGAYTSPIWGATLGGITTVGVVAIATVAVMFLLRRLPAGGRNPLTATVDYLEAVSGSFRANPGPPIAPSICTSHAHIHPDHPAETAEHPKAADGHRHEEGVKGHRPAPSSHLDSVLGGKL